MNEPSDRGDMIINDDVELLTRYLNEQLDPERVAIVARRLKEDPAFLEWAAPLVLAFKLPADSDTRRRPPGEIEKHWDRFTKEAGFVHQRRAARKRKLWMVAMMLALLAASALVFQANIRDAYVDRRDFTLVSSKPGLFTLPDSTRVQLAPNSRLRLRTNPSSGGITTVNLDGAARFLVRRPPPPPAGGTVKSHVLNVVLSAGTLLTLSANFSVAAHGDTADIEVFRDRTVPARIIPDFVVIASNDFKLRQITIAEGERGRIRKGAPAERFVPPEELQLRTDTIVLRDSTRVVLDPGASIQTAIAKDSSLRVTLTGSAHFRMLPFKVDANNMPIFDKTLVVRTPGAAIVSQGASFHVRSLGDTTDVEVFDRHLQANFAVPVPLSERVLLFHPTRRSEPFIVHSGERARFVSGQLTKTP